MNYSELPHADKLAEAFERDVILPFLERSEQLVFVVGSEGHIYYANEAARTVCGINLKAKENICCEKVFRGDGWMKNREALYPQRLRLSVIANGEDWRVHEFDIFCVATSQGRLFVLCEVSDVLATFEDSNTLSSLVSIFCHRMNNFLGIIRLQGELLSQLATDDSIQRMAQNLLKSSHEAECFISRFVKIADAAHLCFENIEIGELCTEFARGYKPPEECELVLLNNIGDQAKWVWGSREGLKSVLDHLCRNAFQALNKKGTVTIRIQAEGNHHLLIEVSDDGPGISDAIAEKMYDPFVTTKRDSHSLGLGLTVCRININLHNGLLTHTSGKEGKGTNARIVLPISERE